MNELINEVGNVYGRLTVLYRDESKHGRPYWVCRCSCGKEVSVRACRLRNGQTKSCGCLAKELSSERRKKAYEAWREKSGRSYDSKSWLYRRWWYILIRTGLRGRKGGSKWHKGLEVDSSWMDYKTFEEWALKNEASPTLQIDRIDNSKGYFPWNCRWVSNKVNMRNRDCTVRFSDGTPLCDWLESFGIKSYISKGHMSKAYTRAYNQLKTCGCVQGFLPFDRDFEM